MKPLTCALFVMYACSLVPDASHADAPIAINSRLEIFVDPLLIDRIKGAQLHLHDPVDRGVAIQFDRPWEGAHCGYATVIKDGTMFRLYYRGVPTAGKDGNDHEVTCYAESHDGISWTKPNLELFDIAGSKANNVVLANAAPASHNLSPFLDDRPGIPAAAKFKALGGTSESGLIAYVSPDGIRWQKLRDEPVLKLDGWVFDSQNVAFWSPVEDKYILYFRKAVDDVRSISRATSSDFVHWDEPVEMSYSDTNSTKPSHHLYTSQTHPYFRAPHIYLATAARFMPGRQVLSEREAHAIGVHPDYYKDTSDAVLLTTRAGTTRFDRTFLGALVRPGIGAQNWVSRSNYPALNIVPTGPVEMSLYVNQDNGQPTAHLRRYTFRTDGLSSLRAPYEGGELVTKPITFTGNELVINFATSAAGGVRVELQTPDGTPISGFALDESTELVGNEIERRVTWHRGQNLSELSGRPVRVRFVLNDADVYSFQFRNSSEKQVAPDQGKETGGKQGRND